MLVSEQFWVSSLLRAAHDTSLVAFSNKDGILKRFWENRNKYSKNFLVSVYGRNEKRSLCLGDLFMEEECEEVDNVRCLWLENWKICSWRSGDVLENIGYHCL